MSTKQLSGPSDWRTSGGTPCRRPASRPRRRRRTTASSVASSSSARASSKSSALSVETRVDRRQLVDDAARASCFSLPRSCARLGSSQIFGILELALDFGEPHRLHIEVKDTSADRWCARADPRASRRSDCAFGFHGGARSFDAENEIIAEASRQALVRACFARRSWATRSLSPIIEPLMHTPGTRSRPSEPDPPMHTPDGFTPSHARPAPLPATTLAFAFATQDLVGGPDDAPIVPRFVEIESSGIGGDRHYLGDLPGRRLRRGFARRRRPASPPDGATSGCARCSSGCPSRCSRSPRARSRSSNGTARTATAAAAARRRATRPASARRNARRAAYVAYPRVSPAMMVLVTRGTRAAARARASLPARRCTARSRASSSRARRSRTASAARCARKSASRSATSRYFASQSWAFPHSLMIAYTAEYAGGEHRARRRRDRRGALVPVDALPQLPPSSRSRAG